MTQTTSGSPWTEDKSVAQAASPVYFVSDGMGGVTISLSGPERYAAYDPIGLGDYTMLDLTPVYIVADGGSGDMTINQIGPAIAILVDDGAGGVTLSTNLALTPIADLYYDTGSDLWMVRRSCKRLHAVQVGVAGVTLY